MYITERCSTENWCWIQLFDRKLKLSLGNCPQAEFWIIGAELSQLKIKSSECLKKDIHVKKRANVSDCTKVYLYDNA